jgi:NADPH-dependent stearoyl-CoA 9-desaturase
MTADTIEIESPLSGLSTEQIDALAVEFDAIRDRVRADLGERDRRYIESMIGVYRLLAVASRALLLASNNKPARWAGTVAFALARNLENLEIGHNVLHGQWDWMNDPQINSASWE